MSMDENNAPDNVVAPTRKLRLGWEYLFLLPAVLLFLLFAGGISLVLGKFIPLAVAIPIGIVLGFCGVVVVNACGAGGNTVMEVGCNTAIPLVLILVLGPVFLDARAKGRQNGCASNLKQVAMAMRLYANDHDERLPLPEGWQDAVTPYFDGDKEVLRCTSLPDGSQAPYGFAPQLAGEKLGSVRRPDTLPLVYDSEDGKTLKRPGRHRGGNNVAFTDAHVEWMRDNKSSRR